jgi:hypothetical protein
VLLAVLIFLVVLLVVADRVVARLAGDKAADALQQSQGLTSKPSVSFAGFPFLTQLAAGRFSEVTVTARGVDVGRNASLHIATVTVHLHDVTASQSYHRFAAARADADATIAYADLSRTLGAAVSEAGTGRVQVHGSVPIEGATYTGTLTAGVHASSARGLTFVDPRVRTAGETLSPQLSAVFAQLLAHSISLQGLPFHVRVTGVTVTSSGLVLHLAGRNLSYSR